MHFCYVFTNWTENLWAESSNLVNLPLSPYTSLACGLWKFSDAENEPDELTGDSQAMESRQPNLCPLIQKIY